MFFNSPIHPSFMPFVFVTTATVISFSVIIALNVSIGGTIEFEILGQTFSGASGPAILWVLTFLTIMAGFSFIDGSKLASTDIPPEMPSTRELFSESSLDEVASDGVSEKTDGS